MRLAATKIAHDVWQDVGFTLRLLRKSPVFAGAAILTLALGVGVNVAVFSVFNALLLRPLPVRAGDRLVVVASEEAAGGRLGAMSFPDLEDYRTASAVVFEEIAGYSVGFLGLTPDDGRPERVLVSWVTGNYFRLLGIRPAVGRLIEEREGGSGRTDSVVVLGYSAWQRRFGGNPSIVGTVLRVDGVPCTVVGVAPPGFLGTFAFSESELFLPLNWRSGSGDFETREARGLHTLARLRPGATIEQAQATAEVIAERLARQHPDSNGSTGVRVLPERLARPEEQQARANAIGAAIMLAMVGLVMVVAAVNVTNLLLARATARLRELAIRSAVGAGRGRLIRQTLTESMILAALGGALGAVIGTWVTSALETLRLPGDLPVRFDFGLDARVLGYTVAIALVSGALVGVPAAARAASAILHGTSLQSRSGSSGVGRVRGLLIVGQIAVTFVLLVTAGLFVRSLFEAERADLGFRPEGVLNVHMDAAQAASTQARGEQLFDEVARSVRSIPGVESVSYAFTIPLGYVRSHVLLEAEGLPVDDGDRLSAGTNMVGPGYFETMGIPLVQGRSFNDTDREQSPRVAIVNQRLADALWPGRNPLGLRFRSSGPSASWTEVVGVVNAGKYEFLFETPRPYLYVPIAQSYTVQRVLQVRTSIAPEALARVVENTIRGHEPNLLLYDIQTMRQALGSGPGYFPLRAGAGAIALLGALAFVLATVGLYGVVSYLTVQRTREIAVRVAVGATRYDVVRLVVANGMNLVVAGVAAGLVGTFILSRLLEHFLFAVSSHDMLTLGSVTSLLACVALFACAIPAWRASHVDPTVALRSE